MPDFYAIHSEGQLYCIIQSWILNVLTIILIYPGPLQCFVVYSGMLNKEEQKQDRKT